MVTCRAKNNNLQCAFPRLIVQPTEGDFQLISVAQGRDDDAHPGACHALRGFTHRLQFLVRGSRRNDRLRLQIQIPIAVDDSR